MGDMTCFNAGGDLVSLPPYRVHTDRNTLKNHLKKLEVVSVSVAITLFSLKLAMTTPTNRVSPIMQPRNTKTWM